MKVYRELGERVERAFERAGRDVARFPEIAAEALHDARIPERSSAEEVLDWVFRAKELPPQNDLEEAFGEPPVTVARGRDFHVEVLFWQSAVTTVHGHGFSGAFQALSGERLQTRHSFEPGGPHGPGEPAHAARSNGARGAGTRNGAREDEARGNGARSIGARSHGARGAAGRGERASGEAAAGLGDGAMMLGEVRFLGGEVLAPGDVVEISPALVHAVVHLAEPSATIVVRTPSDPGAGPQLDLRAPWVAHDPFVQDEARMRKLGALRLLCRSRRAEALARAAELAAGWDLATCLGALETVYLAFETEGAIAEVIEAARAGHGPEAADRLLDVLREERRLRAVHALRARVSDPGQRLFLAMLHHAPSREDLLGLLAARFPGEDPAARALALATSLSGVDRSGVDLGDALTRALAVAMLRAGTPDEVRGELAKVFDPAQVRARAGAIDQHAARMRRTMLAPLFRPRSPSGALAQVGSAAAGGRRAASIVEASVTRRKGARAAGAKVRRRSEDRA